MLLKFTSVLFFVLFAFLRVYCQIQACTTLGQNPTTAFPVCGTAVFSQDTVPYCGGKFIPGPCSSDAIADANPFWYKFTCYTAGSFGFVITPIDLKDDYDWELFDITGHDPNDVYTDVSLFVACNWSGNTGQTGASSAGKSLQNCAGYSFPTFSAMPLLKVGHNYILLLSHFTTFTPSQKGYQLSFGGGTASITDTLLPNILNAKPSCDATQIIVKLNKKMKCKSLDPGGTDFSILPAASAITGATGIGCSNSFDLDSVMLTLSNPLPAGNYTITIKNGNDGNTLSDDCDRVIPQGNNLPLTVFPFQPTPMDSLAPVGCAPQSLQLVFKKNIRCNSIAANGSDFIVTGPTRVTILNAAGNCTNGLSDIINIILSAPITSGGNYKIQLVEGTDNNTIINECGQETPAGATLHFTTVNKVSAAFSYNILSGCAADTIAFTNAGGNGIDQWLWKLGERGTSKLQDPTAYFNPFGSKQIVLSVSNGVCTDTVTQTIPLGEELKADFETTNLLCPEDAATFLNKSTGDIARYYWDFGNGHTSISTTPPPLNYPLLQAEKIYAARLVVESNAACFDTAIYNITVLKSCYIAVPNAFTPNGDGLNDYLYPLNAYKADNLEFNVYNRLGQLIFSTSNWMNKWDGKIKGYPQDSGVYVWTLKYTNHDTGKKVFQKGSTVLIR